MTDEATALTATYFEAWKARDFATLRAVLAEDVKFEGPLASLASADECVAGLRGMSEILADIVIHKVFVDGPDVLTWFDLHTTIAPPTPTANWSHIEGGKIAAIQVSSTHAQLSPPAKGRPSGPSPASLPWDRERPESTRWGGA